MNEDTTLKKFGVSERVFPVFFYWNGTIIHRTGEISIIFCQIGNFPTINITEKWLFCTHPVCLLKQNHIFIRNVAQKVKHKFNVKLHVATSSVSQF